MQNPAFQQFVVDLMMLMLGAGLSALWFTLRRRAAGLVLVLAIIMVSAIGYGYGKASKETCSIAGQWVRFYDTPELCHQPVVDRMAKDSDNNGDSQIDRGVTQPVTANIS